MYKCIWVPPWDPFPTVCAVLCCVPQELGFWRLFYLGALAEWLSVGSTSEKHWQICRGEGRRVSEIRVFFPYSLLARAPWPQLQLFCGSCFHWRQEYCFLSISLWPRFPSAASFCEHQPPLCHPLTPPTPLSTVFPFKSLCLGYIPFAVTTSAWYKSCMMSRLQSLLCATALCLQNVLLLSSPSLTNVFKQRIRLKRKWKEIRDLGLTFLLCVTGIVIVFTSLTCFED